MNMVRLFVFLTAGIFAPTHGREFTCAHGEPVAQLSGEECEFTVTIGRSWGLPWKTLKVSGVEGDGFHLACDGLYKKVYRNRDSKEVGLAFWCTELGQNIINGAPKCSFGENCKRCNKGYHLGRSTKISQGYHLAAHNRCVINECVCRHGTPKSGTACLNHEDEVCKSCQAGYELKYSPNSSAKTCTLCAPGTFFNKGKCTVCTAGKYQPSAGQYRCLDCPQGQYQSMTGQRTCSVCAPGSFADKVAQPACQLCEKGKYQRHSGKASCSECPLGHYQNKAGQKRCERCAPGHFANKMALTVCQICPKGAYQEQGGQGECNRCSRGKYQPHEGQLYQSSCRGCDKGEITAYDGEKACHKCPKGWYQDYTNQSFCLRCGEGQISKEAGSTSCQPCDHGEKPTLDRAGCYIPSTWNFLVAQAPLFLTLDVIIMVVVFLLWGKFSPVWSEELEHWGAQDPDLSPRCFRLPEILKARQWHWKILMAWDIIDWFLFTTWFIEGKPGSKHAQFDHDYAVAIFCCSLIFFGPVLPAFVSVLPRDVYMLIEVVYDLVEGLAVFYVSGQYGFSESNQGAWLQILNYLSTIIDLWIIKGPEAVNNILKKIPLTEEEKRREAYRKNALKTRRSQRLEGHRMILVDQDEEAPSEGSHG